VMADNIPKKHLKVFVCNFMAAKITDAKKFRCRSLAIY
jgi:hypothetical protein